MEYIILLFHTKDCESFLAFCNDEVGIIEYHRISGEYNYLLKVATESMRTLEEVIHASGKHGNSTTLIVLSSPIDYKMLVPALQDT